MRCGEDLIWNVSSPVWLRTPAQTTGVLKGFCEEWWAPSRSWICCRKSVWCSIAWGRWLLLTLNSSNTKGLKTAVQGQGQTFMCLLVQRLTHSRYEGGAISYDSSIIVWNFNLFFYWFWSVKSNTFSTKPCGRGSWAYILVEQMFIYQSQNKCYKSQHKFL